MDPNTLPLDGPPGLVAALATVPEMRRRRGVRHPLATTLAVAVLGLMCGMPGYRAIGQWAQSLTPTQRQRLGCFRSPSTGRWVVPSIETLRRTLIAVDPDALSAAVATYLARALPSTGPLALDGKTRRHSASSTEPQRHLLGVVRHRLVHLVAQADAGEKENEIPVAQRVRDTLPLTDTIVTADALHPQTATAQQIVDRGGEYLFTVQQNQPTLHQLLAHGLDGSFSPSADRPRERARSPRDPHDSSPARLSPDRVPGGGTGRPARTGDGASPQHDGPPHALPHRHRGDHARDGPSTPGPLGRPGRSGPGGGTYADVSGIRVLRGASLAPWAPLARLRKRVKREPMYVRVGNIHTQGRAIRPPGVACSGR